MIKPEKVAFKASSGKTISVSVANHISHSIYIGHTPYPYRPEKANDQLLYYDFRTYICAHVYRLHASCMRGRKKTTFGLVFVDESSGYTAYSRLLYAQYNRNGDAQVTPTRCRPLKS